MSFVKLPTLLFSFLLCFFLQSFCMLNNVIILPAEMMTEIALRSTYQTYINIGRTSTSHYKILNDATTLLSLQRNYIQQSVRIARHGNTQKFDFFIQDVRPCIKNEIEKVEQFFKKFPETKDLSLINIYAKNQQTNNPYPLQEYGIINNTQKLSDIVNQNICVGNLIYYQGYPIKAYENISLPGKQTLMHYAAFQNNIIALDIAFQIPTLSPNTYDDSFKCTPAANAILHYMDMNNNISTVINKLMKHPQFNLNQPCNDLGDSLLIFAIKRRNKDTINILLNTPGINLEIKNNSNKTALDIAQDNLKKTTSYGQEMQKMIDKDTEILTLIQDKINQLSNNTDI